MPEMNMPGYVAAGFMTCTVVASQEARLALTVPQATGKIIKQTSGASGGTLWVLAANGDPSASGDWIRLGDGENPFDQSLNTTDDVAFNSATATLGCFDDLTTSRLSTPGDFNYNTPGSIAVGDYTSLTQLNWLIGNSGHANFSMLVDTSLGDSIDPNNRTLLDSQGAVLVDWNNSDYYGLRDGSGNLLMPFIGSSGSTWTANSYMVIYNYVGQKVIDLDEGRLYDHYAQPSVDFSGRHLLKADGNYSLLWDDGAGGGHITGSPSRNLDVLTWGIDTTGYPILGFFGASPTTQPASADQAAVVTTTPALASYGFTSSQATALLTLTNEMRTVLVNLGLMKGSE